MSKKDKVIENKAYHEISEKNEKGDVNGGKTALDTLEGVTHNL